MTDAVTRSWESEFSEHEWNVRGPQGAATGMVREYVGYEEWSKLPVVRREVARNGLALILAFGDALEVSDGSDSHPRTFNAFAIGNQRTASVTRFRGHQLGVQVELSCAGAVALFGRVGELNDRAIPVDEVLGRWGVDLVEQLGNASGWEARFALLDRALADRLRPDRLTPEVVWLRRQLVDSGGRARVEPLMDETGWSRRLVTERFREQMGVSPKAFARVVRFTRAVRMMGSAGPGWSLADLAMECGYYDQSHFTRDFVALAGCSPTEYLTETTGDPAVRFVQDDDDPGPLR